ncbi:MAG: PEP/pyruvate-binding domain-containing protein [Candidatus Limnocylindrales bacterium]
MSSAALLRLAEVGTRDAAEVGGKAASLGELIRSGTRVPAGWVLSAGAADLSPQQRQSLVRAAAADFGAGPFAIRSSGIAEDGVERSFAGMYESVLNVAADGIFDAIERVVASAQASRAAGYGMGAGGMAVIVQPMVSAVAAGVALTADPITGDRTSTVVTAVRGLGDRLVSGAAFGDEWTVRDDVATARSQRERAVDPGQVLKVATEARRIADARGLPQDIEWAIDDSGTLWILQARPMTALPPDVSWDTHAPGGYTRDMRFGEWIPEPVTPLFESWLLTRMEDRLHARIQQYIGQHAPRPYHVVVNGWYFYSINFLSPRAMLRSLPDILWHLVRSPRYVAGVFPPTVRHSIPILEREWREDILPRYRAAVARADQYVGSMSVGQLPALIDGLADLAGEYFTSIATFSGAAYKMEMNLAGFYRRHIAPSLGGSHLPLVAGFKAPAPPGKHAVASIDWWHVPPTPAPIAEAPSDRHARFVAARQAAETAAFEVLASSPKRLGAFKKLLAETQRLVPIREEHVRELTLAWPAMRRAVARIGETLAARALIVNPDDIFFLTRDEALTALTEGRLAPTVDVGERRALRTEQSGLVPPSFVGRINPALRSTWDRFPAMVGAIRSDTALVSGTPASPGRASGLVRVIRNAGEFDQLLPGEILVAPLTAPAWTQLFNRAAGVVTDVGSAASHASIIAREYGIPAVVGTGDATARLRTGMRVTIDGGTGNVEPG